MFKNILVVFITILSLSYQTQAQRAITIEDIWEKYTFYGKSLPGFNFQNDGRHFTRLEEEKINQYDLTTGQFTKTLFDAASLAKGGGGFKGEFSAYTFNKDESKIILETEVESIYRRSTKGNYFVYDFASKKVTPVCTKGKQMYASFNEASDKVAFVRDNDLYYMDIQSGDEVRVTKDGVFNKIINGATDWVYEEEFSLAAAI